MQCYQYLASTLSVANALETLPDAPQKLPLAVVADWMEENGLDAQEVLRAPGDEVRTSVKRVLRLARPRIAHAA